MPDITPSSFDVALDRMVLQVAEATQDMLMPQCPWRTSYDDCPRFRALLAGTEVPSCETCPLYHYVKKAESNPDPKKTLLGRVKAWFD